MEPSTKESGLMVLILEMEEVFRSG
jgi:hypothetical protein